MRKLIVLFLCSTIVSQLTLPAGYAAGSSSSSSSKSSLVSSSTGSLSYEDSTQMVESPVVENAAVPKVPKSIFAIVQNDVRQFKLIPNQIYRTWWSGEYRYFLLRQSGIVEEVNGSLLNEFPWVDIPLDITRTQESLKSKFYLHNLQTNQVYVTHEIQNLELYFFLQTNGTILWLPKYEAARKNTPIREAEAAFLSEYLLEAYRKEMALNHFPTNKVYRKTLGPNSWFLLFDDSESIKLIGKNEVSHYDVVEYDQLIVPKKLLDESAKKIIASAVPTGQVYRLTVNNIPRLFLFRDDKTVELIGTMDSSKYPVFDWEKAVLLAQEEKQKALERKKHENFEKAWALSALFIVLLGIGAAWHWYRKIRRWV